MTFTMTLVRHGQSTMNVDKIVQSYSGGMLSELGERQSLLLGEYLQDEEFSGAYSSDLTRAAQTARLILSKNRKPVPELQLDSRFRERNYGKWEGKKDLEVQAAAAIAGVRPYQLNEGVAEKYEDFKDKCCKYFLELCDENSMERERVPNILLVTHGAFILSFFDGLKEKKDVFIVENFEIDEAMLAPANTSFSKMRIEKKDDSKYIVFFDSVCESTHLKAE